MIKKHVAAATALCILLLSFTGCNSETKVNMENYYRDKTYFYPPEDADTASDNQSNTVSGNDVSEIDSAEQSGGADSSDYTTVSTARTDEELSTSINNTVNGGMKKLAAEKFTVYDYNPDWAFNHGAYINYFNGKYYAFWQMGYLNEDSCGQHVAYSVSADGQSWSAAKDFIPVKVDRYGNEMLSSPIGTYVHDGKLIVYITEFGYDPNELANSSDPKRPDDPDSAKKLSRTVHAWYTTDGVNWTKGSKLPNSGGGNRDPKILPSGRLFWAGFTGIAYTDDLSGLNNWITAGPRLDQIQDALKRGSLSMLTEGAVYQSKDNVIHFLMRSNTQYLWATSSKDNGETWSDIYQTNFTDDCQKFDFLHLPDGRIMYIGTPGYTGYNFRMPLVAAVSKDGYNFDKQYIIRDEPYTAKKGASSKLGNYSYPSAILNGDFVYVIYAKQKEIIEVSRFKWTDLV